MTDEDRAPEDITDLMADLNDAVNRYRDVLSPRMIRHEVAELLLHLEVEEMTG